MKNETNMTPDTTGATGEREKFTPAPWKSFGDIVGTEAEDGKIFNSICQVHPADLIEGDDGGIEDCVHGEITLGNSRLIAESPLMFRIIKNEIESGRNFGGDGEQFKAAYELIRRVENRDAARSALAKAKGGDGE